MSPAPYMLILILLSSPQCPFFSSSPLPPSCSVKPCRAATALAILTALAPISRAQDLLAMSSNSAQYPQAPNEPYHSRIDPPTAGCHWSFIQSSGCMPTTPLQSSSTLSATR